MFYDRTSRNLAQVIPYRPGHLEVTQFNGSLPTKVIIHGFGSSCNRVWAHEMREALLFTVSSPPKFSGEFAAGAPDRASVRVQSVVCVLRAARQRLMTTVGRRPSILDSE